MCCACHVTGSHAHPFVFSTYAWSSWGVKHDVVRFDQSACPPTPLLTVGMALYDRRDLRNHNQALALDLLRSSCTCHGITAAQHLELQSPLEHEVV